MMTTLLQSVRLKILLVVLVTNFLTLMVAGSALLYHDFKENQAYTVAELTTLADILARGSTTALEFDDTKAANENLMQLRANANIVAAAIYDAHGRRFAQIGEVQQHQADIPGASAAERFQINADQLQVFKQIFSNSELLGTVYIRERYDLRGWFYDYLVILGLVLLVSLGIGQAISTQLQRTISDPIQEVSRVAREVMEQRSYHLRASKRTEDEVGQMADAFNGMLQTLEYEIAERSGAELALRSLNAQLEERVAERTSELQITNQSLLSRTDEAEKANRAKADFLANMSHEIRTPMNGILGLAYLLSRRKLDHDSADMVKKIQNAGRSLQAIINDILDFSKIEAGKLDIEQAPFRLLDVYENLAGIISATAGNKDIELVIAPPPVIQGQLYGDALRLEQVMINLVGNAVKFTEHGVVKVGFSLQAIDEKVATVRFSVSDTGMGISSHHQENIFNSFSQADTSITRRFGGTGLGLTICRHLVSKMGGEIGVISEPGKGSEFWFTIPFAWTASAIFAPPELLQLDVLIADDNDIAGDAISLTARMIGWNSNVVATGEAAVDKVRSRYQKNEAYDVLLLDWQMPGMDGLQTAAAIRHSYDRAASLVILMVTAFSREELLIHPSIGYVDDVLSKPVTQSSLYNCVATALQRRGSEFGQLPVEADTSSVKRLAGVRLLIVDDSEINREVAHHVLEDEGATVVQLKNDGRDALDWLIAHPDAVDIVLMDVQMPVMDGYAATRELRLTPAISHLPVVALTAGAFKEQQDAAQLAGMDAFVAKPFNVEEIIATIQRLTNHHEQQIVASETSKPAAAVPAFSDMPGISVATGLKLWKDIRVYVSYVVKFLSDNVHCGASLNQLHADGNHAQIMAMAHKLKGTASNLALPEVVLYASELELDADSSNTPALIALLQAALITADVSAQRLMQQIADTDGSSVVLNNADREE